MVGLFLNLPSFILPSLVLFVTRLSSSSLQLKSLSFSKNSQSCVQKCISCYSCCWRKEEGRSSFIPSFSLRYLYAVSCFAWCRSLLGNSIHLHLLFFGPCFWLLIRLPFMFVCLEHKEKACLPFFSNSILSVFSLLYSCRRRNFVFLILQSVHSEYILIRSCSFSRWDDVFLLSPHSPVFMASMWERLLRLLAPQQDIRIFFLEMRQRIRSRKNKKKKRNLIVKWGDEIREAYSSLT